MQSTSSASTTTSTTQRPLPKNPSSSDSDSYFPVQPPVTRNTHSRMPSSSTNTSTTSGPHLALSTASHQHEQAYKRAAPKHSHRSSPLSFTPSPSPPHHPIVEEEEWDNTPTSRWGYVLLFTTWLVFVIGMGSCLDVWSWAWDVGETPYAPPELEDDPTLPIVGYYPALMVLTAVMAWVWVGFAWVGMKYFKHAKITGE